MLRRNKLEHSDSGKLEIKFGKVEVVSSLISLLYFETMIFTLGYLEKHQ